MASNQPNESLDEFEEDDPDGDGGTFTISPAGFKVELFNEAEKDYYERVAEQYQTDNAFQNMSDLQELDKILSMEVMGFRWSNWLINERDYEGEPVNLDNLQRDIANFSKEVRLLKKSLGIDKATRDRSTGNTLNDFVHLLMVRAKQFGVMRDMQNAKSIELWQDLVGRVTLYRNCSEEERRIFNSTAEELITWIESKIPEFEEIDAHFRENQRTWIREL